MSLELWLYVIAVVPQSIAFILFLVYLKKDIIQITSNNDTATKKNSPVRIMEQEIEKEETGNTEQKKKQKTEKQKKQKEQKEELKEIENCPVCGTEVSPYDDECPLCDESLQSFEEK